MGGDLLTGSIYFLSLADALSYRRIIATMVYKACPDISVCLCLHSPVSIRVMY